MRQRTRSLRSRVASLVLLALLVPALSTGCRPFCGVQQWQCDSTGVCLFGTQPGYGRFAPPGPHPHPQVGGQGYVQPYGGPVLGQPMELQSAPPTIESF